jgi:hypothetical protein
LEDLKGFKVAVKEKATGEDFAKQNGPKIGFEHNTYLNTGQPFKALIKG